MRFWIPACAGRTLGEAAKAVWEWMRLGVMAETAAIVSKVGMGVEATVGRVIAWVMELAGAGIFG